MADRITINIGKEYSRFPVGRYLADGDSNGEKFREELLRPALTRAEKVEIVFDDALGYGSSFLEEVFGGLVRSGHTANSLLARLTISTADDSLKEEIEQYIRDASA